MKIFLCHLILVFTLSAQIFITEIERNPPGSESVAPGGKSHEYIELFNATADTLIIDSLAIIDGKVVDKLIPHSRNLLFPGEILLILDPDYFDYQDQVPLNYPVSCLISEVNHSSICGGLSGSNGFAVMYMNDTVALFRDSISSAGEFLFTSFEGKEVDENVINRKLLFLDSIWKTTSPSPGELPGLTDEFYYEYLIRNDSLIYEMISLGPQTVLEVSLSGSVVKKDSSGYFDRVRGAVPLNESITSLQLSLFGDSVQISDTINLSLVRIPEGAIIISEVSPRGDVEWLELQNRSSEDIILTGWKICNESDTFEIEDEIVLPSGELFVIAEDELVVPVDYSPSGWFSLNNYTDTLFLVSPFGVVDSVLWNHKRFTSWEYESLHRVPDSDGFASTAFSPEVPTPGGVTEIAGETTPITLTCLPQLFSPDNDGREDSLKIIVTKPAHYESRIRIFTSKGEEIRQLEMEENTVVWYGDTYSGTTARRGPYVVIGEFTSTLEKSVTKRQGVVLWR